jgi:bacterioferritin (cytochrome b1)
MIQEDLVAERIAIESYSEIIRYLGNDDPTSRVVMEKILGMEEEHADDMKKLLERVRFDEQAASQPNSAEDMVDKAAIDSFPASDAPAWTAGRDRKKQAS